MESNNIKAAVGVGDFEVEKLAWYESGYYDGSVDFYSFMTTPSPEREAFVAARQLSLEFLDDIVVSKI